MRSRFYFYFDNAVVSAFKTQLGGLGCDAFC